MLPNIWPFRRLRTYTQGSPVYSNDLNELQDAIIHGKHGPRHVPLPLGQATNVAGWTHDIDGLVAPAAGGFAVLPLAFPAGTEIHEVTAWWNLQGHPLQTAGASDVLVMYISRRDPFADVTEFQAISRQIGDASVGDHASDRVRYVWRIEPAPLRLLPGSFYRLAVSVGQLGRRLEGITVLALRS